MTEEDKAKAHAEYDAIPGTPADGYSFRSLEEFNSFKGGDTPRMTDQIMDLWDDRPIALGRATLVEEGPDAGFWLEVWWTSYPQKQAKFDPAALAEKAEKR